ncbi:MAG TPA: PPC domain-containing protein [Solimonas sp.]|nr:PPC domain-containing protein [Solimonas sp.]
MTMRAWTRPAVAFLLASWSVAALADPPYGDDFDAPNSPDAAVQIGPTGPAIAYRGIYTWGPDVDFYRFEAREGQDIEVTCTSLPLADGNLDLVAHPCAMSLIQPADGSTAAVEPSTDASSSTLTVKQAPGGVWRLAVGGEDMQILNLTFGMNEPPSSQYYFSLTLTPAAANAAGGASSGEGGAGALGQSLILLLTAAATLRRRWLLPLGFLLTAGCVPASGGGGPETPATVSSADTADFPIQPGAPKFVHGGTFNESPWNEPPVSDTLHADVCTMNWVFADAQHLYIGSAGHCALEPGTREASPEIGEFGTVVFRVYCSYAPPEPYCPHGGPITDDFALIQIDDDKLGLVSPVMRGVGAAPDGHTTSDATGQGDVLVTHGWGIPFSTTEEGRTQTTLLYADDAFSFTTTFAYATTHSGSPFMHQGDGRALGILTTHMPVYPGGPGPPDLGAMTGGPTVERILLLLHDAGFEVELKK